MNRYTVRFQSSDERVFEVTLKAHGLSDDTVTVKFYRKRGPFGLWRETIHYIAIASMLSIVCEGKS